MEIKYFDLVFTNRDTVRANITCFSIHAHFYKNGPFATHTDTCILLTDS